MALVKGEQASEDPKTEGKSEVSPMSMEAVVSSMQKEIERLSKNQQNPNDNGMKDLIKELVASMSQKTDFEKFGDGNKYVDPVDMDPADILSKEDAVTFFAHNTGYVIVDDKRNGLPILPPFGIIEFKHQATKQVKRGKETDLYPYSIYTSFNKKEVEFLEKHQFYQIAFFLRKDSVNLTGDAKKAQKLQKFMLSLKTMNHAEVFHMAKRHELEVIEDLNDMRIMIANKLADDEMKAEKEHATLRLDNTAKAKELLGRQ